MRIQPLAFIDTETTGLDVGRHEIIQIGCVVARQVPRFLIGPQLQVLAEYEWKVKPEHIETADPQALAICQYDPAAWTGAITLKQALEELTQAAEGAVMVGHNVAFDSAFLQKAFDEHGVKNLMHYHKLDTISLAYACLYDDMSVEKYSLRNLCAHFGIVNQNAHTALSDARATLALYKKLFKL